ncbi:MAG: hypothetical protein IJJ92_01810 [Clostridia bacterium]|nr:hypothetical protein [Clostridia bacterium]
MIKILLFLATEKGFRSLKKLTDSGRASEIGCVVSFHETNVVHDWSEDIRDLCEAFRIPFRFWKTVRNDLDAFVREERFSGAVAISWKYLIPLTINESLVHPLIVFHDSLLPKYRGFTPTATAILCGDDTVGVSALFATEEVDRGAIVLQRSLAIPKDMYMKEIVDRQAELYAEMLSDLLTGMNSGDLSAVPQNESEATYSIWRDPSDCEIQWADSANRIYDFIRALGDPYLGAYTYYDGSKIIIRRSEVLKEDLPFAIRQPGKIWSIRDNIPAVICGSGMLCILEAEQEDGTPALFSKLRCRLGKRSDAGQ